MLFRETEYARPTQEQYALLGQAVVDWSIIDLLVESLIARLVRAPDFPMMAVTKRLGTEARNTALRDLAEIHQQRYGGAVLPDDALANIPEIRKQLNALKAVRNKVAHWIWIRQDDHTLFATQMLGRVPKRDGNDGSVVLRNDELTAHLSKLPRLAALIEATLASLPKVDEDELVRRAAGEIADPQ